MRFVSLRSYGNASCLLIRDVFLPIAGSSPAAVTQGTIFDDIRQ